MARAMNADVRALIAEGAFVCADLIDLYSEPASVHVWDWDETLNYDGVTYQPLAGQMTVPEEISAAIGLSAEPFPVTFDGSRIRDQDHPIGKLRAAGSTWHLKPMCHRRVVFHPETMGVVDVVDVNRGWMETDNLTGQTEQPEKFVLTCHTTKFRIRGRNYKIRDHADQQLRDSTDTFFEKMPLKIYNPPWFGVAPHKVPGSGYQRIYRGKKYGHQTVFTG